MMARAQRAGGLPAASSFMRLPVFSSRNYATALLRARSSARNPPATEWIYVTGSLEKKQQRLLPFSRNEILDRKPTLQNAVKEATDSEAPLGLHPDPLGHPTTAPTILSYLTHPLGAYPLSAIRARQYGAGLC
jgi:hypothetical protein